MRGGDGDVPGGWRAAAGRARRRALLAAPLTAVLTLGLLPAVALAGERVDALRVVAPDRTDRGSVVVRGTTFNSAKVRLAGGLLPVTAFAGADGAFAAEVVLRPGRRNAVEVAAFAGDRRATRTVRVRQRLNHPTRQVTGRVLDVVTRAPVPGAAVRYGDRTAVADGNGRYLLTGLPEGGVAVSARAAGRFGGVVAALVDAGTGAAGDLLLQAVAAPVRVGPEGAAFSGPGWRVRVPAGAVRGPTDLTLTTLENTGDLDTFGSPAVGLGPKGVRLAKPITVAVDPSGLGLDAASTRLVAVDADAARPRSPRSTPEMAQRRTHLARRSPNFGVPRGA